ncbi:MAG: MarR family transcriptional regulator [Candidatus Saccharimonas sp.]
MTENNRQENIENIAHSFYELKRFMHDTFREVSDEFGVPPTGQHVVLLIGRQPNMTIGDLARELGVTRGAATQIVDGLERDGFVVRQIDEQDRRIVRLALSTSSSQQLEQLHRRMGECFVQMLGELSNEEIAQLRVVLHKIIMDKE